jgi:hypothetical protein
MIMEGKVKGEYIGSVWRDPVGGKTYQGNLHEGQMVTDLSAIKAQVVMDEVLGLARPQYLLRKTCSIYRSRNLNFNVDIATKLTGREKVPRLVEAEIAAEAYSRKSFTLWKNVVHIAVADEAAFESAHDVIQLQVKDAARDIARMENKQIIATYEGETGTDGNWSSNGKPISDLTTGINTMLASGYSPDYLICSPTAWALLISHDEIAKFAQAGLLKVGGDTPTGTMQLPAFPTLKLIVDNGVAANTAILIDSKAPAVLLGEGPTETAQYRNEAAGYTAYIIRQYLQPQVVIGESEGGMYRLTGLSS